MKHAPLFLFEDISKRRWVGFGLVWLLVIGSFGVLFKSFYHSMIEEIRLHARGVAVATAAAIQSDDVEGIWRPADMEGEAYRRVQGILVKVSVSNPDVRYIYTMRRATRLGATPRDLEYLVDEPARDRNANGVIDKDEVSEPVGKPYDASNFPRMIEAWDRPAVDDEISSDPPYPDLLSGYAPIKNAEGRTVAIVGVDITDRTILTKLTTTSMVIALIGLLLALLLTLVVELAYRQRDAIQRNYELRGELSRRYDELRHALRMREDLSRMIVHDMRNHLTVIELGCQLLRGSEDRPADERELVEQMSTEAQRLNSFINDLLISAKMEDGKLVLNRTEVNLGELLGQLKERSSLIAQSYRVKLVLDLPSDFGPIPADANLLQRVFDNLVTNAMKFSPPNSTITVRAEYLAGAEPADPERRHVRIEVADEGPGIEEKYREAVFDRFGIVEMKKNHVTQVGLGLAFCKMVVEAHHGRIFVQPNKQRGSVFTVEI
ncbi:MAG: ATP-binding protein [bacterium]